ncbi:hypothetical protein Goklo_024303 [Gossypium klotzschianum]|uniref:Uncharacterized protein n=1 Tax=Gossypium klotzschianum TaxID=34286 RepID=A0A7J8WDJ2_9ROSI|nr:hypothetical protein [Gossypium klotzschianum]
MSYQSRLKIAILKIGVKVAEDCLSPWFFTGMATGFFVGFWGALVSLLIDRSLRHGYFQLVKKLGDWIRLSL